MQIKITKYDLKQSADCLILPVSTGKQQALITTEFNNHYNKIIDELLASKDLAAKYGEVKWLYNVSPNIKRVMLIGIGESSNLSSIEYINLLNLAMTNLSDKTLSMVINGLIDISFPKEYLSSEYKSLDWKISQAIICAESLTQGTKTYFTTPIPKFNIKQYHLSYSNNYSQTNFDDDYIKKYQIISRAIKTVKDLANTPANICHPEYLENHAIEVANRYHKIKCSTLNHKTMREMGMGSFCAVSQGSGNSGRMIILEYNHANPDTNNQPYILIGKGITFDTGGYSLKTSVHMVGMKYDMSGAANIIAVMQAIAELNLNIHVVGILACAENMISNTATRPDDIVTTLSGKTVEINNTDAEGRLVLCDTITYSERYKPKVIIDIATLTGAVVVALGYHYTGLYSNDQQLTQRLLSASELCFDPLWPMPLCHDYNNLMKSPIADLKNSSGLPVAGSITAACFLYNFVPKDCAWAHLDIAGSATVKSEHKESTGRPVQLLINYLIEEACSTFEP